MNTENCPSQTMAAVPEGHPESDFTTIRSSMEEPIVRTSAIKTQSIRQTNLVPTYDYLRTVSEPLESTEGSLHDPESRK